MTLGTFDDQQAVQWTAKVTHNPKQLKLQEHAQQPHDNYRDVVLQVQKVHCFLSDEYY